MGLFILRDFFFFKLCVNKRSVDNLVIHFTLLTSYVLRVLTAHLHFLVHLCLFLWLPCSEEATKAGLFGGGAHCQWNFGEPHSGGGEGTGAASRLRVTEVLNFAAGRDLI